MGGEWNPENPGLAFAAVFVKYQIYRYEDKNKKKTTTPGNDNIILY